MASATVDSPSDRLQLEALPLVDLRLLSQSELYALSLSSSSDDLDLRRCDDVVIPKIDRSVFNESAGSRKQTYSRLRLAPRKPEITTIAGRTRPSSARLPTPTKSPVDDPERVENVRIIGLLKELFATETHDLVPIPVEYSESVPELSNVGKKRKRGRKPKSEKPPPPPPLAVAAGDVGDVTKDILVVEDFEDRDMEVVNKNGVVVDVVALANADNPFGPELKRRTEGLETEAELLGFLWELKGQWGSRRKKRKIVEASDFGDVLPNGWKLLLCLKKKEGRSWLICRRYISPNGRQFVSCKEVSSYLLSFFELQDGSQPNSGQSDERIGLAHKMASGNAADFTFKDDNERKNLLCCLPLPITSVSNGHEKQVTLSKIGNPGEVQVGDILKCHKCTMTFDERDDLLHHLLSSHKRTAKRCKFGTSISDGVIIRDGKYECQFCHKIFHERNRYNGHVGVHVKTYVKSVEASPGAITMRKSIDPIYLAGAPSRVSMMQASIGVDRDDIAKTFNAKVNDELESGSPNCKLKACSAIESYTDKYKYELNLWTPDEKQDMMANRKDKILVEESWNKQDRDRKMTNDKLGKVDEATDIVAAKLSFCLSAEDALSNNENNNICETSDETNVFKCTTNGISNCCVGQERSSESSSLAPFGNEETCGVKNNLNGVSPSMMEEPNQEIGSESGLLGIENSKDGRFTSTVEELKISEKFSNNEPIFGFGSSHARPDEDVVTEVKQQRSSDGCSLVPFGNEQKCGGVNNVNRVSTSIMPESKHERGSESGVPTPSGGDGQTCGVKNNVNMVSASTTDEMEVDEVYSSGNNELIIGFGGSHTGPDEDAVTIIEQEKNSGNCLFVPSWNKQTYVVENNANGVSTCVMEEPRQEIGSESGLVTPSSNEQTYAIENIANKVSTRKMEGPKFDEVQNSRNSDLFIAFGGNHTVLDANVVASTEQERSSEGCLLVPSGNEQTFGVENNVTGVYNSTLEEPKKERGSKSGLLGPSCDGQTCDDENNMNKVSISTMEEPIIDEVNNPRNSELIIAFGSNHTGLDVDVLTSVEQERSSEGCSLVPSGNEQIYGVGNNLTRVYNRTVEEPKQERGSEISLHSPSGNGQTCCVEFNLNRVCAGTDWEGPKLDEVENSGNTELMIGFGGSYAQPDEDVVAEVFWRTDEENIVQSGLADTSSPLVQSSGCFPTFDIISDKCENELFSVNEKFDSISGFEGLKSGTIEHLEFSFLTTQNSNSLPEDSKVLSYDAEMDQGFDSSVWLEKEALLPKIASRHQVTTVCVWCGNEFHHEAVNSGTQTGSIGSMCPTCNAKISGQLNVL